MESLDVELGVLFKSMATSFGPRARNKLFVSKSQGRGIFSADGATILNSLHLRHPGLKLIAQSARVLQDAVGDGTTSMVILTIALIRGAKQLQQQSGFARSDICMRMHDSAATCLSILDGLSATVPGETLRDRLATTLSYMFASKPSVDASFVVELLLDAAMAGSNTLEIGRLRIVARPGASLRESKVLEGILVSGSPVRDVCAVSRGPMKIACLLAGVERIRTTAKLSANLASPEQLMAWKAQEEQLFVGQAHVFIDCGVQVVLCTGKIHTVVLHVLTQHNVLCFEKVPKNSVLAVAAACKARARLHVEDLEGADVGECSGVSLFEVCSSPVVLIESKSVRTVLLRGLSPESVEETERLCRYAIRFMLTARSGSVSIVPGGGVTEAALNFRLLELNQKSTDHRQVAVNSMFAECILSLPRVLAENDGLPVCDVLDGLRSSYVEHCNRITASAEDAISCRPGMLETFDALVVKRAVIELACNVAIDILSIHEFVVAKKDAPGLKMFDPQPPSGAQRSHQSSQQSHINPRRL